MVRRPEAQACHLDSYQDLCYLHVAILSILCPYIKSIFTGGFLHQPPCQLALTVPAPTPALLVWADIITFYRELLGADLHLQLSVSFEQLSLRTLLLT